MLALKQTTKMPLIKIKETAIMKQLSEAVQQGHQE